MNIQIRLLREDEINSVNEVYNRAYGNIRPDDYFLWEFLNGPFGKALYIIAEDLDRTENRIIGTQSAIPIYFINGKGEKILTAKSEDTFVHPDYRGQKLFDRMYEELLKECYKINVQYIWGFTYASKPFLKIGFEIPFDSRQGILILNPIKAAKYLISLNKNNGWLQRAQINSLSIVNYIYYLCRNIFQKVRLGVTVNKIEKNNDILLSKILSSSINIWSIQHNESYIDWRLIVNPYANKYFEYSLYEKDIKKICVLINKLESGVVYIEEMLFDYSVTENVKIQFIKSVIRSIKSDNKNILIRFWGFNTNEINKNEMFILEKCGFTFIQKGTSFVWRKCFDRNVENIDPQNILLSRLYTQGNR